MKVLVFLVAFATLVFPARPAASQPLAQSDSIRQAQALWRKGTNAAAHSDYKTARAAFEQAFELIDDPALLFALGDAEVRTGHFVEGAGHLEKFLATETATPAQREASAKALESAATHVAKILFRINTSDAAVEVDGHLVGHTPLPNPIVYLAAGSHAVRVEKGGHQSLQKNVEIGPGESATIEGELLPIAPEPPPVAINPAPQGSTRVTPSPPVQTLAASSLPVEVTEPPTASDRFSPGRTVAIVTGSVLTAAAVGLGVTFFARRESAFQNRDVANQRIGSGCANPGSVPQAEACQQLSDAVSAVADDNKVMNWAFPAAAVLGAATVATAIFWPRSSTNHFALTVVPTAERGVFAGVRTSF